jgi:hypothetical protein
MADITMCSGEGCNRSLSCYRHTAPVSEYWQSMFIKPPLNDDGSCDNYWDNSEWQQSKSAMKHSTRSLKTK